jgi:PhnB protein
MSEVSPIPADYPRVSPYLLVAGAADAIDFYADIFGAVVRVRMDGPGGKVGHAELGFGDSVVMLADEHPEMGILGPRTIGGTPVVMSIYVDDVDSVISKAVEAGAVVIREIQDQFYGDRSGQIEDPFGHRWSIQTHVEDVDPDEMQRRAAAMAPEA